jgi:hypothetical protein
MSIQREFSAVAALVCAGVCPLAPCKSAFVIQISVVFLQVIGIPFHIFPDLTFPDLAGTSC